MGKRATVCHVKKGMGNKNQMITNFYEYTNRLYPYDKLIRIFVWFRNYKS